MSIYKLVCLISTPGGTVSNIAPNVRRIIMNRLKKLNPVVVSHPLIYLLQRGPLPGHRRKRNNPMVVPHRHDDEKRINIAAGSEFPDCAETVR